jgi:hypothetical protein
MPDFLVRRDDLRTTRVDGGPDDAPLTDGEARLRVERFGFTANNVTYAAFGEAMGYWKFFPAQDGWGRIPVWGFGEVTTSKARGIDPGRRFYGYFPMSSAVVMRPRATAAGFEDAAEHRAELPATYNRYFEATPEAGFAPEHDAVSAVMRPLFMTGWLIARQLAGDPGGGPVALASASSKTAYSTAYALSQLDDAPAVIGLTSARNAEFVRGLGFYDTVLTYDEVDRLPRGEALRFVDMAGDADLRRRVHEHLGDDLRASIVVGATHWDHASLDDGRPLPGPRPEFFFAPAVIEQLAAQLGAAELQRQIGAGWLGFLEPLAAIVDIEEDSGAEAVERVYRSFLDGTADPRRGHVLNL